MPQSRSNQPWAFSCWYRPTRYQTRSSHIGSCAEGTAEWVTSPPPQGLPTSNLAAPSLAMPTDCSTQHQLAWPSPPGSKQNGGTSGNLWKQHRDSGCAGLSQTVANANVGIHYKPWTAYWLVAQNINLQGVIDLNNNTLEWLPSTELTVWGHMTEREPIRRSLCLNASFKAYFLSDVALICCC